MPTHREFEARIQKLTGQINGQYPRPWMTDLKDPLRARLFIVGRNPATPYLVGKVDHCGHLDALFNRPAGSCHALYQELGSSKTRSKIGKLREMLKAEGVDDILETNVVCYSTSSYKELRDPKHADGKKRGEEIFRYLIEAIRPKVLVAHGVGVATDLGKHFHRVLTKPASQPVEPLGMDIGGMRVFVIPSLAPPQWNHWHRWADEYLRGVAKAAARVLAVSGDRSVHSGLASRAK